MLTKLFIGYLQYFGGIERKPIFAMSNCNRRRGLATNQLDQSIRRCAWRLRRLRLTWRRSRYRSAIGRGPIPLNLILPDYPFKTPSLVRIGWDVAGGRTFRRRRADLVRACPISRRPSFRKVG